MMLARSSHPFIAGHTQTLEREIKSYQSAFKGFTQHFNQSLEGSLTKVRCATLSVPRSVAISWQYPILIKVSPRKDPAKR